MIKKGQKIGQDIIDSVKDIDLISYLESCGESFRKEGDYYRHTTHDSLIIRGNKFSWNSRNEHGYGAIRFNQIFFGMSFRESVQALLEAKGTSSFSFTPVRQEKRKEPFRYPIEQESEQINEAREYLITERKIDSDIVDYCIRKGLIAQDDRKNVVFKWLNKKGEIIGVEKQGTGKSRYKYIFPNEVKHTGFSFDIGTPERILFFESPIEGLSYWSLHKSLKNVRIQSMAGLKYKTVLKSVKVALEEEQLLLKGIVVCVNNDKAGRVFKDDIESMTKPELFGSHLPEEEGFDWNDVLQDRKAILVND